MVDRMLEHRGRGLEKAFFAQRDAEKLEALRRQMAEEAEIALLAKATGIHDEDVLKHVRSLGLTAPTLAALGLVPMIEVAWADGELDDKERQAVLDAATAQGIPPEHPAHAVLDAWLAAPPGRGLRKAWGDYIAAICAGLDANARHRFRDELLGHARAVAEAAGGFLGLGNKVSQDEQRVLDDLASAFPA